MVSAKLVNQLQLPECIGHGVAYVRPTKDSQGNPENGIENGSYFCKWSLWGNVSVPLQSKLYVKKMSIDNT